MIKIKNERGITLIGLIITILVLLILATVVINIGRGDIDYSKNVRFLSYMQAIQKKIDYIAEYENYEDYGVALTSEQKSKLETILSSGNETFLTTKNSEALKYFSSELITSQLELENIDDEIIVDFETREVISLKGIKYENKMYYSQYSLPGGQTLEQHTGITRTVHFDSVTANINGLNATVVVNNISISNGTLSYSTDNTKWTIASSYTTANQNIYIENITKSGTYYFKLVDNTSKENQYVSEGIRIRLTNKPTEAENLQILNSEYDYSNLDSTKWAYARDTSTGFVYAWIPRFAYETADSTNIEFLKGTSELTTSGGYITLDWTLPDVFTGKTGAWVKVNSASQANLDIIEILDNATILNLEE